MARNSQVCRLISSTLLLLAMTAPVAMAKDRDKDDRPRGGRNQPNNPPQINPPQNNQPRFNANPPGGGNPQPRKIEIPKAPQFNPGAGGGNNNPPTMRRRDNDNTPRGNNNPNPIINNPNLGGGQPVQRRRDNDNKPGPNFGNPAIVNPNPGGGPPVFKPRENDNKPGGNNNPNPIINNPNLGGGQPVQRRRDNDNKPGPNLGNPGVVNPNLGGPPVFKPRENDNKPGGNNNPNPIINNPNLGGGQPGRRRDNDNKPGSNVGTPNLGGPPVFKPRDNDNKIGGGNIIPPRGNDNIPNKIIDRNPELKNHLKQFPPVTAKRQENERNLIRNKDQVNQLLEKNPELKNRIQREDGKLDLSKLHLEHGNKHRIPAGIEKDGRPVSKFDRDSEFAKNFQHRGQIKDLNQLDARLKHFRDPDVIKQHPELAKVDWNHVSGNFQHRLAHHQNFDHIAGTNVGRQLRLQQQFQLHQHGDVARQLNLNVALINGGGWKHRYVGPVAAGFTAGAFSAWYCGPGYYPKYCWAPHWSPWVDWCWWNTCPVVYDPRPIYCRPIVYYDPCPTWVVYDYPVWQPLPVVTCGTWVDLPTPALTEAVDLQLLAVRFVDNGHPDQDLGTRYRVWLRNESNVGIGGNFNVLLLASNSPAANADLPQAGVTIPSMEPGEMKVVDIRLPFAASKMNRVDNHSTPFEYLHVLVDSHRQLDDVNLANNGAVIPRVDILPVDPAAFAPDVSAAAPGAMVSVAGEGFGPEPGRLIVSVNGVQSEPTIYGWYDLGVQFELPNVPVNEPTNAEILIVRGDGAASNPVNIRLAPENRLEEAALPPAPEP